MLIIDKLIMIGGVLAFFSFIATAISLSRESIKKNKQQQKKIEVIGAFVFSGLIVLVRVFAYIIHKSALADLKLFVEMEPEKIQVTVNNELYKDGKAVISAIQNIRPELFDADMVSNNDTNIKFVSLIKGNQKVNLRLVQHGERREYYVYYPLYLSTDKNPLGLLNFWQ